MPLPNFFILGAAKSGTTSLYDSLGQHPEIYLAPVKEPSFFCASFQLVSNPVAYAALFAQVRDERAIGEASHVYLTAPESARALHAFFPEARFILCLRHPADRAYSLYHHMVRYGHEWHASFESALQAERQRLASARFRRRCRPYFCNYLYFHSGLYSQQIGRYLALFPPERFFFCTLDQLAGDAATLMPRLFTFLGVTPAFRPTLKVQNVGYTVRHTCWQFVLCRWLRPALATVHRRWSDHLYTILTGLNQGNIPAMSTATRKRLIHAYADDIALVQTMTGLDLSDWLRTD